MHYDFAITCRSGIHPDATGVGLATRLLLQARAQSGLRCIFFGEAPPEPGFTAGCAHPVRHVQVATPATTPFDNLRTPELAYSHSLFLRIDEILREHSINLLEFPDFQAEGWVFIHHNIVYRRIPTVVVRLHGPRFVLDEDNALLTTPPLAASLHAGELEAIQRADRVLCPGDALRDRVLACCAPQDSSALRSRCIRLPVPVPPAPIRPSPRSGPVRRLGCIGPLEYRLGTDLLIRNAVRHFSANPGSPLEIHCLGPDSNTANGTSFHDYLHLIVPPAFASRFVIESVSPGQALANRAATLDTFVFPAHFASDPALLAPILGSDAPVFVSRHGDLAELARDLLPDVRVFNPLADASWPAVFAALESSGPVPAAPAKHPSPASSSYSTLGDSPPPALRPVRLAVITPHLDDPDHLQSLVERLASSPDSARLEHFVVDDGSSSKILARVKTLCANHPAVTLLHTPRPRSGPFAARHAALRACTADFVALVDSDDYIDVGRYLHYASVLDQTPSLDVLLPALRFFGAQNHDWLPAPKTRATLCNEAYAHIGIVARRTSLLKAFAHAEPAAHLTTRGEDWMHAVSLVFTDAQTATVPEVAYYYNRTNPGSRSMTRHDLRWQGTAMLENHYDRCLAEAMAGGTLTAFDLRELRRLSLALGVTRAGHLAARSNRVPWHTHLMRAFKSIAGDIRYRP